MGSRAGSEDEYDTTSAGAESDEASQAAQEAARATEPLEGALPRAKSSGKKGVVLILAGLVVAGIAAGWNWMRGLP